MASPFAKYQSEQVQQIAPGFVEGFAKGGEAIGRGIASVGASVGQVIAETEKRKKEEIATKAALAPYIKNDQRVQVVEGLFKAGILTKATDGTAVVAADYAGKVDMAALEKNLSFYNTTGGDGSKLSGNALIEFTARLQSEQKYVSDQAGRAKAKLDLELQQAQIDDLKSKAAERVQNAGMYDAANNLLLGGTPSASASLPYITLPDTSNPLYNSTITGTPATKADTTVPAVAVPAVPAVSAALTAGTAATPAPAAPTSADFDQYGYPKQKPATEAPAPAPAPAPAKAAAAPAAPKQPAAPAAAPAPAAAAPAAPVTYDVPAKAAEVAERMKTVESKRTAVRAKFANIRTATEGELAVANANVRAKIRPNEVGNKLATATAAYNDRKLKSIADAEDRETKALDAEADSVRTEFTNYQAAATAARQGRQEDRLGRAEVREIERDKAALTKEESETVRRIVKGYPMISVFTYQGYGMKDPKTGKLVDPALTAGIQEMPGERYTEASEQIKGYNSAQDFLLNMKATLRERESATGNRAKELGQRFLLTASNMENYFKAELASVFGVAAFRKPIVSGGNFSDADREFVRQAITYLNTANPSMSNKDLESSLKALSFMVNGLYQSQIEGLGMTYNPEAAKARATALTSGGDKVGAGTIQKQVERTDRFYKSFNLNQGPASSISRAQIDAARSELQRTLRFEFSTDKARKDNEAALKASIK